MIINSKMLILCYTCSIFWRCLEGAFHKTIVFVVCLEHWDPEDPPRARANVTKTIHNGHGEHPWRLWTLDAEASHNVKLFSKIGLATERLRAIDLSCRACGAGAGRWAWIPGGGLRCAPVFTPNLRYAYIHECNWIWGHDVICDDLRQVVVMHLWQ